MEPGMKLAVTHRHLATANALYGGLTYSFQMIKTPLKLFRQH